MFVIDQRTLIRTGTLLLFAATAATLSAQGAAQSTVNQYGNPLKLAPKPTGATITPEDLRTRLYQFADDSMLGRQVGTIGNTKGTAYIASEVKRLGLEPAGDNGTYFQALPYGMRYYSPETQLTVGGQTLRWGTDLAPGVGGTMSSATFNGVQVIYGGVAGDTAQEIATGMALGRLVVLSPNPDAALAAGGRGGRGGGRAGGGAGGAGGGARGAGAGGGRGGGRGGFAGPPSRFVGAVAVATFDLDAVLPAARELLAGPPRNAALLSQTAAVMPKPGDVLGAPTPPPALRITRAAAQQLMGGIALDSLRPGTAGARVSGRLAVTERMTPELGRNVVAILRGSDPTLRNEYVAIGAHNDHIGFNTNPVDHDSLRAVRTALYAAQMADGKTVRALTAEARDSALAKINWDEVRKHSSGRRDSVNNGADDDGSGSMAVLEIAEALSMSKDKLKRSVIFVWHTGEEAGLTGSRFFTDNPTVPITSIVAQINIDMIGRGRADDLPGGGPDYLAVVGSKRLSTELGNLVASVNKQEKRPLKLDYEFDDSTAWSGYNNIYGRSDHANYARKGIPIAFFFTGLHRDYHQLTDEPQYIDYPHYARITNYIRDLMVAVANAPHRPVVDKPVTQ